LLLLLLLQQLMALKLRLRLRVVLLLVLQLLGRCHRHLQQQLMQAQAWQYKQNKKMQRCWTCPMEKA
jgi:hypothetical protein